MESRVSLTAIIDDISGRAHVHLIGSGGRRLALIRGDGGAGEDFEDSIYDAIYKYIIE